MKNAFKIFASLVLALAICLSAASCAAAPVLSTNSAQSVPATSEEGSGRVSGVSFLSASPAVVAEDGTMSQTITAGVIPSSAKNQAVDWGVVWVNPDGEFESTHTVTDYVTVTPESDGSETATVTAHRAFEGTQIGVVVTTRQGGYTAQCVVNYVGVPDELSIDCDITPNDKGFCVLNTNTDYSFDIALDNAFGVVTDTYKNAYSNLTCSFVPSGEIVVAEYKWSDVLQQMMPGNSYSVPIDAFADQFEVTVADGVLHISVGRFSSKTINMGDGGTGLGDVIINAQYVSGIENCSFEVTVTDKHTGLSDTIEFGIYIDVTGVGLDNDELIF